MFSNFLPEDLRDPDGSIKMAISQDEIVSNAQTVTKGLEALRVEHEAILGSMKERALPSSVATASPVSITPAVDPFEEKRGLIEKSLEMIDLGLDEAHVMSALASHLQSVEAEKQVCAELVSNSKLHFHTHNYFRNCALKSSAYARKTRGSVTNLRRRSKSCRLRNKLRHNWRRRKNISSL